MDLDPGSGAPYGAALATLTEPTDIVPEAAAEESAKLQRHFDRFDVFFFLVCTGGSPG